MFVRAAPLKIPLGHYPGSTYFSHGSLWLVSLVEKLFDVISNITEKTMNNNEPSPGKTYFANYSRRIQAALLDGIILVIFFVGLIVLASNVELSQWMKVSLFVFVGLLFEPLLVSMTGASLGHHYKGLRVEKDGDGRNLNIFEALFRFLIKSVLGTFSLVFFLITKRHKALHDMAVNSVVVMNKVSIKKVLRAHQSGSSRKADLKMLQN